MTHVEELARATMKKLTQGMAEHNKAMAAAKTDEAKDNIVNLLFKTCVVSFSDIHFLCHLPLYSFIFYRKPKNRILQLVCEPAITFWL